jgi:hypothetical protein
MDWHRLFGLLLTDFFTGSPFVVELEKDLSLKQQFLDVVILRKGPGPFNGKLPDGLDDLAAHNLITFKSHHEALDDWALKELTGHYVNYRKQLSEPGQPLLPEGEFHLYAVCSRYCSRYPHNLAGAVPWEELRSGVYRCVRGTDVIRVVVARQLPEAEHNAPLHLFSASEQQVIYGRSNYRLRSEETSTLLSQLFQGYQGEGLAMPYTMADFRRDYVKEHLKDLTPEERLEGLSPEERREALKSLPPEERLEGLSPEERLEGLSSEELLEALKSLPPEELENCLKRLKKASSPPDKRKGRRKGQGPQRS